MARRDRADLLAATCGERRRCTGARSRARPTTAARRSRPASSTTDLQRLEDGVGPLFHRRYPARIRDAQASPEELHRSDQGRPELRHARPSSRASTRFAARDGTLRAGDEFIVRMPGPWDGPVRVAARGAGLVSASRPSPATSRPGRSSFARRGTTGSCTSAIESWARSGDRLSNLLYAHLRMAKEVQLHMWTSFLERVAELAGGRLTRRHRDRHAGGSRTPMSFPESRPRTAATLAGDGSARCLDRPLNFDPATARRRRAGSSTTIARRSRRGGRPAGAGRELGDREPRSAATYAFADPVPRRGALRPGRRRSRDRDMLLVLHALGPAHLRRRAGGRGRATGDATWTDGTAARSRAGTTGRSRATSRRASDDYEVWKWLDTGDVEFRTHAVSRPAAAEPRHPAGLRRPRSPQAGRVRPHGGRADGAADRRALGHRGGADRRRARHRRPPARHLLARPPRAPRRPERARRPDARAGSPREDERSFGTRLHAATRDDISALDAALCAPRPRALACQGRIGVGGRKTCARRSSTAGSRRALRSRP